jgi:peptidoglycan-associated lipoprotein
MTHFKLLAILLLAVILGACAGQDIPDPEPTTSTAGDEFDSAPEGFGDEGLTDGEEFYEGPDDDEGELAMVIYFDFDQSEIRPDDQVTLEGHARRLANNAGQSVRLEGHADERGSREYNIGLGERRAQAVRRLLLVQGASSEQITTVSFGEERPAAFGSDEESYAMNRRVEFRYTN